MHFSTAKLSTSKFALQNIGLKCWLDILVTLKKLPKQYDRFSTIQN